MHSRFDHPMTDGPPVYSTLPFDRPKWTRGWIVGCLGMAAIFSSVRVGLAQNGQAGTTPTEQLGLVVPPRENAENRSDEEQIQLAKWIEDLSAPRFQTREDATEAIAALGEDYLSDLENALGGSAPQKPKPG